MKGFYSIIAQSSSGFFAQLSAIYVPQGDRGGAFLPTFCRKKANNSAYLGLVVPQNCAACYIIVYNWQTSCKRFANFLHAIGQKSAKNAQNRGELTTWQVFCMFFGLFAAFFVAGGWHGGCRKL